jgi:hypothetical protein
MAESNHHSSREPAAAHSMPTPQPDDPLAGLARLIDETVTMNDLASDLRRPKPADSRSARELNLTAQHGYAASDVLQETSEEQYSTPAPVKHDSDPLGDSSDSDDGRCEPSSHADSSRQSRSASYEHEPQWHPDAEDLHAESSDGGYDEHEDQSQNQPDDHTYGEDYDEDSNSPRRGKFIFVAAVLGVALLGTGGAFGYRALFADSIVPSLPSIINAEGGPNKIIPTSRDSQGTVSPQSDADNAVSSERLEAREERPLDVPPPVTTALQPGVASVLSPMAQPSPAARVDSFNSPPVAPSPPIQSADQAPPPDAPTVTPASPAKQGPEKTRIRTDQPNTAVSAATQPQSVPVRPTAEQQVTKPSDANGPLSIVPSSNDAANAAPGSTRTAPPERSAALGKPAATEIASKAPAASGGDYAVQVLSQHNEEEVQSSFRALQAKYPKLLGGREPMVRRADLGAKGVYYRAMVGPFVSAKEANELCSRLKAAGGSCIIQKN